MQVKWKVRQLRLELSARLGRSVKQDKVCQKTGLSPSRLSVIESDKTQGVEFDILIRLAKFYHVQRIGDLLEFVLEDEETPLINNKRAFALAA